MLTLVLFIVGFPGLKKKGLVQSKEQKYFKNGLNLCSSKFLLGAGAAQKSGGTTRLFLLRFPKKTSFDQNRIIYIH
jgi:hypothetical protein